MVLQLLKVGQECCIATCRKTGIVCVDHCNAIVSAGYCLQRVDDVVWVARSLACHRRAVLLWVHDSTVSYAFIVMFVDG